MNKQHGVYGHFNRPPVHEVVCKEEEGKTRQSDAVAADVNNIIKQFDRTGLLPQVQQGMFMDVSEVGDYQSALAQVRLADSFFMSLPAAVRAEFGNNPAEFLDFAADPANRGRLQELGLVPKEPEAGAVNPPAVEP